MNSKKNSEIGFNELDKESLEVRLEDAVIIKTMIEEFFKTKEGNLLVYEDRLGKLVNTICFDRYKCDELQKVLLNYIMNNIHYIYHLINMKSLDNPKKHLKSINKILQKQLLKIVCTYIKIYEFALKEEGSQR